MSEQTLPLTNRPALESSLKTPFPDAIGKTHLREALRFLIPLSRHPLLTAGG